uniref:Uncharacterized protein n=1 Tax=Hyaloperonospora arabidopsidis (strain Emoy2) TaxID=559515 RepID=M4BI16_HYAAE
MASSLSLPQRPRTHVWRTTAPTTDKSFNGTIERASASRALRETAVVTSRTWMRRGSSFKSEASGSRQKVWEKGRS